MSSYEDAARKQAANDSQVKGYIRQGQNQKAIQRVWEIVQGFAQFLSNVANVVVAVLKILGLGS